LSKITKQPAWRRRFVGAIYATHNRSPAIRQALRKCLARIKDGEVGLNVGAGSTNLHPGLINLDILPGPNIHCCAQAEYLPFANSVFSIILTQETLEHVRDPWRAICEMYRVLQEDGTLYCQLPFIIGYHPGPTDFWRFSKEGIRTLVEHAGFICEEIDVAVGPATGFYRVAVEFLSVLLSRPLTCLYYPIKGLIAVLFYPIKWLDRLLLNAKHVDRIAGGYYIVARKRNTYNLLCVQHSSLSSLEK
jgi:SAM-dependent methyltransferase